MLLELDPAIWVWGVQLRVLNPTPWTALSAGQFHPDSHWHHAYARCSRMSISAMGGRRQNNSYNEEGT